MTDMQCNTTALNGFPLIPSKQVVLDNLNFTENNLKKITFPTNFSVQWPAASDIKIRISNTEDIFEINGISSVTANTSLVYGDAKYDCSDKFSILKNQHRKFCREEALYELILCFQISNKQDNPSSPDIFLITRPIVFSEKTPSSQFLSDVNSAMEKTNKTKTTNLDISKLIAYDSKSLLPMYSYQTCLPVKIINNKTVPEVFIKSIVMNVNVIMQPLYVNVKNPSSGIGLCSNVTYYTLTSNPLNIFLRNPEKYGMSGTLDNSKVNIQFKDGYSTDGFPKNTRYNNLTLNLSSKINISELINRITIILPEALIKSETPFAEYSNSIKNTYIVEGFSSSTSSPSSSSALRCYAVDSARDIRDGKITIGPNNEIKPNTDNIEEDQDTSDSGLEVDGGNVEDYVVNLSIYIIILTLIAVFVLVCSMIYMENKPDPWRISSILLCIAALVGLIFNIELFM